MQFDHFVDFLVTHVLAKLLKSKLDVRSCNPAAVVCVELLEDCLQPLVGEEFLSVNRGCQELAPVDLPIALVVELFDHILDLLLAHLCIFGLEVGSEILRVDHPVLVLVHLLENLT